MAACSMASTREAIGGEVRATRMASSAAAFQSVTTSANARGPGASIKSAAIGMMCFIACRPASIFDRSLCCANASNRVKPRIKHYVLHEPSDLLAGERHGGAVELAKAFAAMLSAFRDATRSGGPCTSPAGHCDEPYHASAAAPSTFLTCRVDAM